MDKDSYLIRGHCLQPPRTWTRTPLRALLKRIDTLSGFPSDPSSPPQRDAHVSAHDTSLPVLAIDDSLPGHLLQLFDALRSVVCVGWAREHLNLGKVSLELVKLIEHSEDRVRLLAVLCCAEIAELHRAGGVPFWLLGDYVRVATQAAAQIATLENAALPAHVAGLVPQAPGATPTAEIARNSTAQVNPPDFFLRRHLQSKVGVLGKALISFSWSEPAEGALVELYRTLLRVPALDPLSWSVVSTDVAVEIMRVFAETSPTSSLLLDLLLRCLVQGNGNRFDTDSGFPPSFWSARSIVRSGGWELTQAIGNRLRDVLRGWGAQSAIGSDVWFIISEVQKVAPAALAHVIPLIDGELESTDPERRRIAAWLLGKMFVSDYTDVLPATYHKWCKGVADVNEKVRMVMARALGAIMMEKVELRISAAVSIAGLPERDFKDRVSTRVKQSVVQVLSGEAGLNVVTGDALKNVVRVARRALGYRLCAVRLLGRALLRDYEVAKVKSTLLEWCKLTEDPVERVRWEMVGALIEILKKKQDLRHYVAAAIASFPANELGWLSRDVQLSVEGVLSRAIK
ncbi:hypothetical protein TeGR_g1789, partial [Tetraparma gracilis]